jgi:hypothetical protein
MVIIIIKMTFRSPFFVFGLIILFSSCKILQPSMTNVLENGDYILNSSDSILRKVYLSNQNEDLVLSIYNSDSTEIHLMNASNHFLKTITLNQKNLFDIDLITTPVKFRPGQSMMQPQLNSSLNASVYIGLRNNYNLISYKKGYNKYQRYISSYGLSYGLFAGLSNTSMNPWVTKEHISKEYDGVVFSKGVSGIIGLNKFTIGLSIGIDNLLDPNKKYWIYEGKPWVGISFGLNVN